MAHHNACRAMFHDESIYPAPRTYDPERYLKDGELDPYVNDPEDRIFGSGRRYELFNRCAPISPQSLTEAFCTVSACRICPGRYFAMRTIFLNVATILTVFDIRVPLDEKLEPRYDEEHLLRYAPPTFSAHGCCS